MDLIKNLTYLELLDMRARVNDELENFKNREKIKVFSIFIPFIGTISFLNKDNAQEYLRTEIFNENFTFTEDGKCYIETAFVDKANTKYCEDYIEDNNES